MDKLNRLRIFIGVAETGSFTKAAEIAQIPRSTVSAAVQLVERQLQVQLFHRTTRRVHLTDNGKQLLLHAKQLLADVDELEQLFLSNERQVHGRLHINAPSRMVSRLIAPALPHFFADYPEIYLELGATDREVELVAEGVDCAIRVGDLADSRLIARKLGELTVITCASAAYLSQHGHPQTLSDLKQHWAVRYRSPLINQATELEFQLDNKTTSIDLKSRISVDNAEAYIACAVADMGLIQVPAYDVQEQLATGALVQVLPQFKIMPLLIHAMYPHRDYLPKRLTIFLNWLQALIKKATSQ